MKTITPKYLLQNLFVGILSIISLNSFAQTVIHNASFETNNDGWTLTDASRQNDSDYAADGNYSMRLADNSGELRSPTFALATYDKVEVQFYLVNNGLDDNETITLEYREDNSASWQVVNAYTAGNISDKDSDVQRGDNPNVDYAKTIAIFKSGTGSFTFPASATGQFRFVTDADDSDDRIHVDNVTITGTVYNTVTLGPGGVSSNLELWLRSDRVDDSGVLPNNTALTTWEDTGKGNDANTVIDAQAPTYLDNTTDNINFNPVIKFSNSSASSTSDMTYLTTRDEIAGSGGFYSHDFFVVVIPDEPINTTMIPLDTFTAKNPAGTTAQEDVTGFGYGSYTNRFVDEYFAYCIGTTSGPGNGYGKGDLTFGVDLNQVGIVNGRHNSTSSATGQNVYFNGIDIGDSESDPGAFAEISNQKFYLGRSQYWNGSFGGRIAEVVTYSATNTDANATDSRNRIMSYLAIKYGITLGVNGTSQDYANANGAVIWDQSDESAAFNYDIAGIGRSDRAGLMQRQSKSLNTGTVITMGITDIAATNSANTNDFANDENYVVWGNDNDTFAAAIPETVDLSAGFMGSVDPTVVEFTSIERTWRVQETGDVGDVKVSLPEIALSATITPPGSYLMFISDTPTFNPDSEYRIMTLNGANLETTYDFPANDTKFITFGFAPMREFVRSVDFDGSVDYMDADDTADLTGAFTISAWIMADAGNTNADIVSKRNSGPFTTGYSLRLGPAGQVQGTWKTSSGVTQSIFGNTTIPSDKWHYVTLTYDGSLARVYVDGVLDGTPASLTGPDPAGNSQHLLIAAANHTSPVSFFNGNIDEVRVFDVALSVDQVRYIMNQELVEHGGDNSVNGTIIPQSIAKNDVSAIPWANLMAYYPMSQYTFTNVNDASQYNNVAAIKNLDTVDFQTAPLPYESAADGDFATVGTWTNNGVQELPNTASVVNGSVTVDWNIVNINHDLYSSTNTSVLGTTISSGAELVMNNDTRLLISHYLKLDGFIDLQGESQLLQNQGSEIDLVGAGYMERDQAGTADLYTYNYWSSPVGRIYGGDLNRAYKVNNRFKDGTDASNPIDVNWTWGFDGAPGAGSGPITLSARWIYKFQDGPIGDYDSWSFVGPYQYFNVGEGFTLKGSGAGGVTDLQNYTFIGRPNNDQVSHPIQLSITAGRNYLVGNPFPSALDAEDFIADNPHLDGTLYFWEHWGGGSHVLAEYQGGYATYNMSGGNPAMSHPQVSGTGTGTKVPGRYIPVGQGFFVAADATGTINFNNSQRNFVKPGASSVFTFADDSYTAAPTGVGIDEDKEEPDDTQFDAPDTRIKLRLGFDSPFGLHRQLLVTFDDNTTMGYDRAYDAVNFEEQVDDMNWLIGEEKYLIQGVPTLASNASETLPLYVKVSETGYIIIGLDAVENLGEKLIPYLHDKQNDQYVDLRNDSYKIVVDAGEYSDRFEIVLRRTERKNDEALPTIPKSTVLIAAMHSKLLEEVTVFAKDNQEEISSVVVYNTIGQRIGEFNFSGSNAQEVFSSNGMASGAYILQTTTKSGVHTTKILIEK